MSKEYKKVKSNKGAGGSEFSKESLEMQDANTGFLPSSKVYRSVCV